MPKTSRERARREVSRVEGFSDAVFGFAVTLLVVSLEVPKTFHELVLTMRGFPAIGLSEWLLGEYNGRMRRRIARSADASHS
jgi:hypothetical protein